MVAEDQEFPPPAVFNQDAPCFSAFEHDVIGPFNEQILALNGRNGGFYCLHNSKADGDIQRKRGPCRQFVLQNERHGEVLRGGRP